MSVETFALLFFFRTFSGGLQGAIGAPWCQTKAVEACFQGYLGGAGGAWARYSSAKTVAWGSWPRLQTELRQRQRLSQNGIERQAPIQDENGIYTSDSRSLPSQGSPAASTMATLALILVKSSHLMADIIEYQGDFAAQSILPSDWHAYPLYTVRALLRDVA